MDGFQFIASMVGSLAWPTVVVIFLIGFREPVGKVIKSLARLKYKEFVLDFGEEIKELKSTELRLPMVNLDASLEKEVGAVAAISPMAAIPLAWSHVETEIANAIRRLSISPDYPAYNSALRNIDLLKEHHYLAELDYSLLNKLRRLRNEVNHNKVDPGSVTTDTALDYAKMSFQLISILKKLQRT